MLSFSDVASLWLTGVAVNVVVLSVAQIEVECRGQRPRSTYVGRHPVIVTLFWPALWIFLLLKGLTSAVYDLVQVARTSSARVESARRIADHEHAETPHNVVALHTPTRARTEVKDSR